MRGNVKKEKKKEESRKPVASWVDYDFFEYAAIESFTIILRTAGCQWRKCKMCGYWLESMKDVTQADILVQFERALKMSPKGDFMLKIFTSGSFFDEREISEDTRKEMRRMLEKRNEIAKLIVETRPEFVSEDKIEDCIGASRNFEVAIGLETSNDFVRNSYINKGFSFDDYRHAVKMIKGCGATVKTYLLLKPPFVSEKRAIEDVIRSAEEISDYTSSISLNLSNVQKGTEVEDLWQKKYYRPPWLWSAVEAMKEIKRRNEDLVLLSDPVGAGYKRGPHNCGKCDRRVKEAIKRFNVTQDLSAFEGIDCECKCKEAWKELIRSDDFLFNSELYW
jgi:hypothetical protein